MKVSDYIEKRVSEAGISEVFAVTGGGAMHLDDSFGHSPRFRCTYHHNEQACAMAAEAYARIDNTPACVLVTTGPGATNALTGVLCAYMESIPMLVISGQARYATTVRGSGLPLRSSGIQEYDVTRSAEPMTKYAVMITSPSDVRYCVEKALSLMMSGRRGPVWLDVPLDIQAADIDPDAQRAYDPAEDPGETRPEASDSEVDEVLEHLKRAERPVLFGGYGVRAAGCAAEFVHLAELLGIPVVTGMSTVDLITEEHPLYAGRTGMTGTRAGNFAMAGSDLFLSIGSRLSFLQTGFAYDKWAREAYVIANDIDENELRKPNVRADMRLICDAGSLIRKLTARLEEAGASPEHPFCGSAAPWLERSVARRRKYAPVLDRHRAPQSDGLANIYSFYDVLSDLLGEDEVLLASCGTSRVAGIQTFRVKEGQRFITNTATASMGYDLPPAIGLVRALDGGEVTVVTGEGSVMMNLQELQTIATGHFPVRVFLINNGGYHSIRQTQRAYFGEPLIGVGPESGDLGFPDFEKLSAVFGFSYALCADNETIGEDMRRAMSLPLPAFIEVRVSPLQGTEPKTASKKMPDGSMVSAPLEDMAPFLPREELAENVEIPLFDAADVR